MLFLSGKFRGTHRFIIFLALISSLFFTYNTGRAEEAMTLQESLEKALQDNHEIVAFRNALGAQKEDIGIARSNIMPKLTLEERYLRTNNPTYVFMSKLNQGRFTVQDFEITSLNDPSPESDFQSSLSVFQPLLAMQAAIGIDMSETSYAAKKEEYLRKQEEIIMQVAQNYLMAQMAADYLEVAENGVEDRKEHLRIAQVNFNNGLGLYADTLRASTAVTEAEQKLISAQKNLKVAQRALGMLLGLEDLIATTPSAINMPQHDLEYYTQYARERRDIQSLQHQFTNAQNNLRMQEAALVPTLGVGSSYQLNDKDIPFGNDGESWQVFALLNWKLFDGTKRSHEKQKARFQIAETQEHLERLQDGAAFQVFETFLGVEEARKNAELARAALTTAEEGKRLVQLRYENSLSPLVDLLDAQISLDQARADVLAREKEQQLATLRLYFQSGILFEELGLEPVMP